MQVEEALKIVNSDEASSVDKVTVLAEFYSYGKVY